MYCARLKNVHDLALLGEVANTLGCGKTTIARKFKKMGLAVLDNKIATSNRRKLSDEKIILAHNRYVNECLASSNVAREFGVSASVLLSHFKRLGLKTRTHKEAIIANHELQYNRIKQYYDLVSNGGASINDVAAMMSRSVSSVYRTFSIMNMPLPKKPGALLTEEDSKKIIKMYEDGFSPRVIANSYGVSSRKVYTMVRSSLEKTRGLSEGINASLIRGDSKRRETRKYIGNESFFESWTMESAWVYGLLLSDGSIGRYRTQYVCTISLIDKPVLIQIARLLGLNEDKIYIAKHSTEQNVNTVYALTFSNAKILENLERIGMKPNKSSTVVFPDMPDDMLRHFVRGYIDGDGCVCFGKNNSVRFSVSSNSKKMMLQMAECLWLQAGVGIEKTRFSKRCVNSEHEHCLSVYEVTMRTGLHYRLGTSSTMNIEKLRHYLYDGVPMTLCMPRKRARFFSNIK